jgi:hypothetical protein
VDVRGMLTPACAQVLGGPAQPGALAFYGAAVAIFAGAFSGSSTTCT